eukprot:4294387-Pyramimonas_sp.AAC.1
MTRSPCGPRKASLRCTPQQTSNVARASQIAALQGWRSLLVVRVRLHSAAPPRRPRKWRQRSTVATVS